MCGSGWIPADCVAICRDKDEWLDAWNYPSDQLLVVLDDKIWTEGDKIYVISSLYSLRLPGDDHNTKTLGTIINTLDVLRGDNNTWLHHLIEAMIPFYSAGHEDYKVSLIKADIESVTDRTYNGAVQTQTPQVILNGSPLTEGKDYSITYLDNIDAGTAKMTVSGMGSYDGTIRTTFRIDKANGSVDAKGKTVKLKYSKLKKKDQVVKRRAAIKVAASEGDLTYRLKGITRKSCKKYFKVDSSNGNIKVRKGLKKGTYKLTIKVSAGGRNHKDYSDTVKVKIKIYT